MIRKSMIRAGLLATVAALALVTCGPARTQPLCGPRAEVLEWLAAAYREAPVGAGVTGGGALVEVLASTDGATWTILVTSPGGRTCLIAAGDGWRALKPRADGPKA